MFSPESYAVRKTTSNLTYADRFNSESHGIVALGKSGNIVFRLTLATLELGMPALTPGKTILIRQVLRAQSLTIRQMLTAMPYVLNLSFVPIRRVARTDSSEADMPTLRVAGNRQIINTARIRGAGSI